MNIVVIFKSAVHKYLHDAYLYTYIYELWYMCMHMCVYFVY